MGKTMSWSVGLRLGDPALCDVIMNSLKLAFLVVWLGTLPLCAGAAGVVGSFTIQSNPWMLSRPQTPRCRPVLVLRWKTLSPRTPTAVWTVLLQYKQGLIK